MSKLVRFINQGIKHFFFINRENLRDCRHEFKDSLPDSSADCQFVAAASHLAGEPRGTCLLSVLRSWQTGICQAPAESCSP